MTRAYSVNCNVSRPRGADKHMTLFYLGEQDEKVMNELYLGDMFNALDIEIDWPLFVPPKGTELFGENNDVPVFTLEATSELILAREIVKMFFTDWKIKPKTNFTQFRPHITIPQDMWNDGPPPKEYKFKIYFPHLVSWEVLS